MEFIEFTKLSNVHILIKGNIEFRSLLYDISVYSSTFTMLWLMKTFTTAAITKALFTKRPSFPCARDTRVLGIPWFSLIYCFISRCAYKHARQLIPGDRVSLVLGFPWQSNRETRVLGLSFSHVNASLGITRLTGKTSSWFPDLFWLVRHFVDDDLLMLLSGNFLLGNRAKKSCPWRQGYPYFAAFACKPELSVSLGPEISLAQGKLGLLVNRA